MKRLSLLTAAILIAVSSFAQLSIWNGSSDLWTKGAGTQASPYQIESAEQLAFIAEMVNAGITTYENTYFKLMTNIDLNNLTWSSIGSSETNCFKGNLDGNNKTIFNNSTALFCCITDASISRLNVELEGLISQKATHSIISYCQYTGHRAMIRQAVQTNIQHCKALVNIDNADVIHNSGLVDSTYQCVFEDCYVDGAIKTTNNSIIENDSKNNSFYANLCNSASAGGLVAISHSCKYIRCSSNCIVDGNSENWPIYSAGLIGISCMDTISYCANVASANGVYNVSYYESSSGYKRTDRGIRHSGIIGINAVPDNSEYATATTALMKNNYTTNDLLYVTNYVVHATQKCCGYTGYNYNLYRTLTPTIVNSYTSQDKTEASMKSVSFPIILNADSTIFIKDDYGVNDGYPIYKNQVYPVTLDAENIGLTSAQLNGSFYAEDADSVGFEYKEKNAKQQWFKCVTGSTSESQLSQIINDIAAGTEYVYRLWIDKEGTRYCGDLVSFTTLECSDDVTPISATICNGEEYIWADMVLTQADSYRDTLTSIFGCDSIVELTLNVLPTNNIDKYDTIPTGNSYDFYGEILTETGTYHHYVPAGAYCNLLILHLQVGESEEPSAVIMNASDDSNILDKILRDGQLFILRDGKTYTLQGQEVR